MTEQAEQLLRQALTLPPEDRADVAAQLLASLDEPPMEDPARVVAAWAQEIEMRARRALAGSTGEPWDQVRNRLEQRLRDR